jgi:hypothetical protein
VNFYNPVVSDPETGLSIQGERKYDMDYTFIGASLFLGFSIGY